MGNLLLGNEMHLYGIVGDEMDGFTAKNVAESLAQHGPNDLTVRVNSPGGIAMDGMAIYSLLRAHPGKKTMMVDGVAASAASLIAMAGDEISMRQGAMMMIHDPSGITIGPAKAHEQTAATLHKLADNYAAVYAERSGNNAKTVRAMMLATTWMDAADAVKNGFATTKIDDSAIAPVAFDYSIYPNAPEELRGTMAWKMSATRDLPVENAGWDADAAAKRMLDAAGIGGMSPDHAQARRGFLIYDNAHANERSAYKLPFADFVGGELKAIAGGLRAAASRLPQMDAPQAVKDSARRVIDGYFARMRKDGEKAVAAARARMSLKVSALNLA